MRKTIILSLAIAGILSLNPATSFSQEEELSAPFNAHVKIPVKSYDYNKMFTYSRELLTRPPVQKLLKEVFADELVVPAKLQKILNLEKGTIKAVSEHQFMLLLQLKPELWPMLDEYIKAVPEIVEDNAKQEAIRKQFHEQFKDILEDPKLNASFKKYNDPFAPRILQQENNALGYKNLEFYSNTPLHYKDGKIVPGSDLKQKWVEFIKKADKELVMNVFDFDIMEIADELVAAANRGVDVRVGIDIRNVEGRPEVKAVYDKLASVKKNLKVFKVDSVGLNHQKLLASDWSIKGKGRILTSSGNATYSCSDIRGDGLGKIKSEFSIPNQNHLIVMDSDAMAQLINHELTKTLDMGLRGSEYPLSGAWMIVKDPKKKKLEYVITAFSPSGGLGDVNAQVIAEAIRQHKGDQAMIQFAFSSETIDEALFQSALREVKAKKMFGFKAIGDTSFSGREWSVFLNMIGYTKDEKTGMYLVNSESKWNKLPKAVQSRLRASIMAAPRVYGEHSVTLPDGSKVKLSSKIHSKVWADAEKAIAASSFNISNNAMGNTEVINLWKDEEVVKHVHAMIDGLRAQTDLTLEQNVLHKNEFIKANPDLKSAVDELKGGVKGCDVKDVLNLINPIKKGKK